LNTEATWVCYECQPLPSSPSSGTVAVTGSASLAISAAGFVSGSTETAISVSVFWGSIPSSFFAPS
jgi:hypothetical protein